SRNSGAAREPTTGKSVGKPRPRGRPSVHQPTTGKSVGKPRPDCERPDVPSEPTTGKSVGKPRLGIRLGPGDDEPTTGKSVGKPRHYWERSNGQVEPTTGKSVGKPRRLSPLSSHTGSKGAMRSAPELPRCTRPYPSMPSSTALSDTRDHGAVCARNAM